MTGYSVNEDMRRSYDVALYYMALRIGSRRAARPAEMYWLEAQGIIP